MKRNIAWLALVIMCCPYSSQAMAIPAPVEVDRSLQTPKQLAQQPTPNQEIPPELLPQTQPFTPAENEPVLESVPETAPLLPESEPLEAQPESPRDDAIAIREINILGTYTVLETEINQIRDGYLQELQNRPIALEQIPEKLQEIADAITQLYLNAGYLTSRAIPVDETSETLDDGVLQIQIVEGSLPTANITINWADGTSRPRLEAYARRRLALGTDTPLRLSRLEDQLRLLRADPLFENVEASLRLSGTVGESVLLVTLTQADPFQGGLSLDNYSPPSVGSERLGVNVGYLDLIGTGDRTSLGYFRSTTGGAEILDFSYRVPVNPLDGAVHLRASFDWTQVTDPEFEELNIEGESRNYEIRFHQPIVRNPRQEFALSVGFNYRDGQTFLFDRQPTSFVEGVDEDGVSRTSVLRFSQEYVHRQVRGAWVLRSQFSLGLDWFDATINESPVPDSRFVSWLVQAQRLQQLSTDHLLIVQADLQLTPDSLLPSEQFVIGGGQSLRGYSQNIRSGDNGFRFSVEDQIAIVYDASGDNPLLQVAPFFDLGLVWNHPDNPNILPDQTFLAGVGVGIIVQPIDDLYIRVDGALPLINLDDRGENLQDESLYFSVNYTF